MFGLFVNPAAHSPEITDARHIIFARHHSFVAVSKKRIGLYTSLPEYFLHYRIGHLFSCSRCYSCFDQDKRFGRYMFCNYMQRRFKGCHVSLAGTHIPKIFLYIIALNINNNNIGQLQNIISICCDQCFLFIHAPCYHGVNFGVFSLNR